MSRGYMGSVRRQQKPTAIGTCMDLGDKAVIHWFGRRGGTIENILDQDLTAIQSCAPKICVLVVGGNDLDQGLDPMPVACRLIGLAQVLRNRAGAQQIYILGIIPRPGPRYLTPVKFSEAADACNSDLNLLPGGNQDNKKEAQAFHVQPNANTQQRPGSFERPRQQAAVSQYKTCHFGQLEIYQIAVTGY